MAVGSLFFHEVALNGKLERRDNPKFNKERRTITRKYLLSRSEILRRLWLLRLALKNAKKPTHIISVGQINQLRAVLANSMPHRFMEKLESLQGRELSLRELEILLNEFNLGKGVRGKIVRITENRYLLREFHDTSIFNKGKLSDKNWPLYFAIMIKIKEVAEKEGARVAISSDYGLSRYYWTRYWYQVPAGELGKRYFLWLTSG